MFVPVSTPEEPEGAEVRALRLSLNSPVVQVESLPVGPASAAIALHAAPGRLQVTLALRAERGGEMLFYAPEDPGGASLDPNWLLDAALSFAEGMGFLFDDDEVETRGDAGPCEGARIWRHFAGLAEPTGASSGPQTLPAAAPVGPARETLALELTKFRRRVAGAPASRSPGARLQLLGRF